MSILNKISHKKIIDRVLIPLTVVVMPVIIAMQFMNLWDWDLTIPLVYNVENSDETWQHILTKMLVDTGWILSNPFLGAPGVANWHNNAAAQTSALHSVLMLAISQVVSDSIAVQQIYYLLNFALISFTTLIACRMLGMARLPAYCIAIVFSLLSYRFNYLAYSFIPNYFLVPLALVPVFWLMTGEFFKINNNNNNKLKAAKEVFLSPKFLLGLLFIVLITLSDGYYAFFMLLLLGFSFITRLLMGDFRKPISLGPNLIYIITLLLVALLLQRPLATYINNDNEEFYRNGLGDPAITKTNFEAEIYSLSIKLLVAPSVNHRIDSLSNLGKRIIESSDMARKFKQEIVYVPLGILGTILLFAAVALLIAPNSSIFSKQNELSDQYFTEKYKTIVAASALTLFILLCSITGGIGTLVALVYPTIRAYERFPLFLIFVLYVGAGMAVTLALKYCDTKKYLISGIVLLITIFSVYDQLPNNIDKGNEEKKTRYLSEKSFVNTIEKKLPYGAMVYQYPYSQWLMDSQYYGWGSFAHVRLYLHSANLRWSNGASLNSHVDKWHSNLSNLPIDRLIVEVRGAGFSSVVVDRRVVSPAEYQRVRAALMKYVNDSPIEDEVSQLSFFRLEDPGYRLVYDRFYNDVDQLVIAEPARLLTDTLPRMINPIALKTLLDINNGKNALTVERVTHPEVFFIEAELNRGDGNNPVFPLSDLSRMKGSVRCSVKSSTLTVAGRDDTLLMEIVNDTYFDWKFNQGKFPINIGVHIRSLDGALLRWDDGTRISLGTPSYVTGKVTRNEPLSVSPGATVRLEVPLSQINLQKLEDRHQSLIADFRIVQDGHAWFEHLGCKVVVNYQ